MGEELTEPKIAALDKFLPIKEQKPRIRRKELIEGYPEIWDELRKNKVTAVSVRYQVMMDILRNVKGLEIGRKPRKLAHALDFEDGGEIEVELGKLRKYGLLVRSDIDFESYLLTDLANSLDEKGWSSYLLKNVYQGIPSKYVL